MFSEVAEVDGIVLTKLDGSAKGGVALAICHQYQLPVWYCGIGEGKEMLVPFEPKAYAQALFGEE